MADLFGPVDLDAAEVLAPHRGFGVDEADGLVVHDAAQGLQKLHAHLACAIDQDRPAIDIKRQLGDADARAFENEPCKLTAEGCDKCSGKAVGENHRARNAVLAGHEHDQRPDQHRQPDAGSDADSASETDEAGDEAVKSEPGEGCNRDDGCQQHQGGGFGVGGDVVVSVTQRHGSPYDERQACQIEKNQKRALLKTRRRRAMIRTIAGKDFVALGISARQFDRVLVRIRAAESEEHLAQRAFGSNFCHSLAGNRADFCSHAWRGIRQFRGLFLHGFNHSLVAVTDIHAHRHGVEVEIAFIVHIPKVRALGVFDSNGIYFGLRRPCPKDMFLGKRENFIIGKIEHGSLFEFTILDLRLTNYNPTSP